MHRADFAGPHDLRAMQALSSRCWSPVSRFHPGQLAWSRHCREVEPHRVGRGEAISLWSAGSAASDASHASDASNVVGFGWADADDWLELQVDPEHPDVADEIIDWFEDWSEAESQSVLVMEHDVAGPALRRAGFAPDPAQPFFTHHLLELADVAPVLSVAGYSLRHLETHETASRSACHRASWSQFGPSPLSASAYTALMLAWPYRADLDWVAVDPDGQLVASCLVWLDPASGVGLVEPVGVVPAHRGKGLAAAVVTAALHHLRELGAHRAQVTPRGDDAYPGPARIYRSLGFAPTARTVTWTRSLT